MERKRKVHAGLDTSDPKIEKRRAKGRRAYHKNSASVPERMAVAAERTRAWNRDNKEKALATHRDYVERNREQVAAYKIEWQRQNRDAKAAAARAEWDQAHPEDVAAREAAKLAKRKASTRKAKKKWAMAHPEYFNARSKKWFEQNPDLARARNHARRVAGGQRIDRADARRLFLTRVCFYCGVGMHNDPGRKYHPCKSSIDHVVPISKGGTNESSNLVAACMFCNLSKSDMTLDEYRVYVHELLTPSGD